MISSVFRKRLRLLALPLLAIMLSLTFMLTGSMLRPATVHAQDAGGTITVAEKAQLINRTVIRVTVTATASLPQGATVWYENGSVRVDQVVSHKIVSVYGYFTPIYDGVEHTYQMNITQSTGSPPFHPGPANADAGFVIQYYDSAGNSQNLIVDSGPVAIRIMK